MQVKIKRRPSASIPESLAELHPVLQRIYVARGVRDKFELDHDLKQLLSYETFLGLDLALPLLHEAIKANHLILIIGDYDADGATSTAVMVAALKQFGADNVSYLVPNRFVYGYGLTPELVAAAAEQNPFLIITVDNGITSIDGVRAAREKGIHVIITDHHLPGEQLPTADAIINPNQPGCQFSSKSIAGVGVSFYLMLALRSYLRGQHWFGTRNIAEPNMSQFLDLVALGTVADVVSLDRNNRLLVFQGLQRIRAGKCRLGILMLARIAKRDYRYMQSSDLAFGIAPRLNAAGRMDDMSIGIACLLATTQADAWRLAEVLDSLNSERRGVEADMQQQALQAIALIPENTQEKLPVGLSLFHPDWHQGVIGILAGRIKDRFHRPTVVFAESAPGQLKGSARSIVGVNIRDVLANIASQYPKLIEKFGGHAMAGGLSISLANFSKFTHCFQEEIARWLQPQDLEGIVWSDGELSVNDLCLEVAEILQTGGPWGQSFPEPLFDGVFTVMDQRIVGQRHLKLTLQTANGKLIEAVAFNVNLERWPNERCQQIYAAYRLDINEFNGLRRLQLIVEHFSESP